MRPSFKEFRLLIVFLVVVFASVAPAFTQTPSVLLLHDSGGPWGYLGGEYAVMTRNLLGHFSASVTTMPVTTYTAGLMNSYDAAFYIGSTYDEPSYYAVGSPQATNYGAFLADVATTTRPVVWMNYNLWWLAWNWDPSWNAGGFTGKFGLTFGGISTSSYNRILYKDVELFKGVVPHANPGADLTGCLAEGDGKYACSTELSVVQVADASKAQTYATAHSTLDGGISNPYVIRGENLWFVGDLPFSYHSEEDRYLAISDLLHDMLGIDHPESHRAMVRLEDISAGVDSSELIQVTDLLKAQSVPFSVATVAYYEDPLGVYNGGAAESARLRGSDVGGILRSLASEGWASIVQHGTTHQWDGDANPYNRVTGDDFEFYRVVENADSSLTFEGPLPGDSARWARRRINRGRRELGRTGLTAFAWEAPHYTASAVDYNAIRNIYPVHYGRLIYFGSGSPSGRFVGQFFPFVIESDAYGYQVIPENIGYIEPEPFTGFRALFPSDLVRHAEKALVVRDGVASFYYHPYLGTNYLEETLNGIKNLGYTFVAPCSVGGNCP